MKSKKSLRKLKLDKTTVVQLTGKEQYVIGQGCPIITLTICGLDCFDITKTVVIETDGNG